MVVFTYPGVGEAEVVLGSIGLQSMHLLKVVTVIVMNWCLTTR